MIQRLQRAALVWPKVPGHRVDLRWRDHRRPGPDELDRLIFG